MIIWWFMDHAITTRGVFSFNRLFLSPRPQPLPLMPFFVKGVTNKQTELPSKLHFKAFGGFRHWCLSLHAFDEWPHLCNLIGKRDSAFRKADSVIIDFIVVAKILCVRGLRYWGIKSYCFFKSCTAGGSSIWKIVVCLADNNIS